ncbi:MAG: ubiquinol-cytochrome c reductase cytochrome c subunit [Solirubrobacteraceae bacterium]|jgi:ubiquinol-cytochrome c reductase cytochrome c subunit|nr:ubiquinol-cytochrome c reductase cytochrome c subunit [Solirubrobacteraceae bacterium]
MRRLALTAALLSVAAPAAAQPPAGVQRPSNEAALSQLQLGAALYAGNCSSCHGVDGRGIQNAGQSNGSQDVRGLGPAVRGTGAQAPDFYLRTGYMPLGQPGEQPERSRPLFRDNEIRAMVAYIASLGGGPAIPSPQPQRGNLHEGMRLFASHCSGCHQIAARGGVVTGARVPPLQAATPVQIAEAVRIGPYLMPKFSEREITPKELDSIVRYVGFVRHPPDRGGWGIGNVGPVPEGLVTWLLAAAVLLATCMAIGRRLER